MMTETGGNKNANSSKGIETGTSSSKEIGTSSSLLYYLHPSDNPGTIICPVQLKGENYEEWARSMRNALRAKRKLGFVDGTIEKPADNSNEIDDWWMANSMVVAWIFNTIEPTLRSTVTYMENVKDLWEDLRDRFSMGNGPRVHQIKTDLVNCRQHGDSVVVYYGKLKVMWDELLNYEPIPQCSCANCKCNMSAEILKQKEEERVHQFLMGLDDSVYSTVRSNILAMEPLPNIGKVYSMIIQEERHRRIARGKEIEDDAASFVAQVDQNPRTAAARVRDKSGTCTQCG